MTLDLEAGIYVRTLREVSVFSENPEPKYLNIVHSQDSKNDWSLFLHEKGERRSKG